MVNKQIEEKGGACLESLVEPKNLRRLKVSGSKRRKAV